MVGIYVRMNVSNPVFSIVAMIVFIPARIHVDESWLFCGPDRWV